ncbi:Thp3p SCDLUD_000090 [Saccharomycodes ludwigii]|uniref:Thp3p n=1 Tax=Saccharomycodes ludwigii TaxID=36035 RepID=UPI001E88C007|nr:hypothetical protein SCDLUD_000090 [Saccharomycodes ludwigii]KAH3902513.1 hypothetical protein SCDLUD_000090 [Saccharomycodes ludwigii]
MDCNNSNTNDNNDEYIPPPPPTNINLSSPFDTDMIDSSYQYQQQPPPPTSPPLLESTFNNNNNPSHYARENNQYGESSPSSVIKKKNKRKSKPKKNQENNSIVDLTRLYNPVNPINLGSQRKLNHNNSTITINSSKSIGKINKGINSNTNNNIGKSFGGDLRNPPKELLDAIKDYTHWSKSVCNKLFEQKIYFQPMLSFVNFCLLKTKNGNHDEIATQDLKLLPIQLEKIIVMAYRNNAVKTTDWKKQTLPALNKNTTTLKLAHNETWKQDDDSYNPDTFNTFIKKIDVVEDGYNPEYATSKGSTLDGELGNTKQKQRLLKFSNNVSSTSTPYLEDFSNLNKMTNKAQHYDINKPIVGRCTKLEKPYLRLTSEPNPDLVRPLFILKKSYKMLMYKYRTGTGSYQYLCDQFKSIRQDLRVQLIESDFAIRVYSTHARLALEFKDVGEFNQCQSRLKNLFENKVDFRNNNKGMMMEFFKQYFCCTILYFIMMDDYQSVLDLKYTYYMKDAGEENNIVNSRSILNDCLVLKLFTMNEMLIVNDYHNFFRVYGKSGCFDESTRNHDENCDSDNNNKYAYDLLKLFIDKLRLKALAYMCRGYMQLKLDFLRQELSFDDDSELKIFLKDIKVNENCIITKKLANSREYIYLDCKDCRVSLWILYENSKKINIKGQI